MTATLLWISAVGLIVCPVFVIALMSYRMAAFRKDEPSDHYFGVPYRRLTETYDKDNYTAPGQNLLRYIVIAWFLYLPCLACGLWLLNHLTRSVWLRT